MMDKLHRELLLVRAASILWTRGHLAHPPDQSTLVLDHKLSAPVAKTNDFPYQPLDSSRNEIRLLRISNPVEVDGQVNCALEHVSLDSDPAYEALSYTWADSKGDSRPTESIIINGYPVAITRNLDLAIRNIFLKNPLKDFWVDALCIHQFDVVERNSQVSKMKNIYEKAERVIAWLGDACDNSGLAFETLREILEKGLQETFHNGKWADSPDLEAEDHEKALSLVMIFRRSYWARTWVVQEGEKLFRAPIFQRRCLTSREIFTYPT
jgi:hypothetical protein